MHLLIRLSCIYLLLCTSTTGERATISVFIALGIDFLRRERRSKITGLITYCAKSRRIYRGNQSQKITGGFIRRKSIRCLWCLFTSCVMMYLSNGALNLRVTVPGRRPVITLAPEAPGTYSPSLTYTLHTNQINPKGYQKHILGNYCSCFRLPTTSWLGK
jgi:hypothetical protein